MADGVGNIKAVRRVERAQIQPEKRRKKDICARTFSLLFEKVDARKSTFTGVNRISAKTL